MSDHETIIRTAAQKLAKKYSLPTHIVEEDLWHELKGKLGEAKKSYLKKLWGDQIKTATHPEAPWTLLELNVPREINAAALDVGRWMEANEVRELWGLALRSELSCESRRLDWLMHELDGWDRDNIDDAIDREETEELKREKREADAKYDINWEDEE